MVRPLAGLALGLVLAAGTAGAATPSGATPSAATEQAAPKVVTRDVRLGHKPVEVDDTTRATRLRFRGRKGRLVNLAAWSPYPETPCLRSVLRRDGRKVGRWAPGYWRLRRTATYTVVAKPCADGHWSSARLQVRKVVSHAASVDGPALTVGRNADVTHLVPVWLRAGERLTVDHSSAIRHVVLPDRTLAEAFAYDRVHLEDGTAPGWHGRASTPGRHYVALAPEGTVRVHRALAHTAGLDGPAVRLANAGVASREHVVSFAARGGQWVYGELLAEDGTLVHEAPRDLGVLAMPGAAAPRGVVTLCPGRETSVECHFVVSGPWLVPETGTYRMSASVRGSTADQAFTLRVRAAALAEPLTLDGPPVTYTSSTPGQWVVGPYTEGLAGGGAEVVTAGNASPSLTDWRADLASGHPNDCNPYYDSMGCPDLWHATLTPAAPSGPAPMDGNAGPSMVVVSVPPTVSGSLELTLRRR